MKLWSVLCCLAMAGCGGAEPSEAPAGMEPAAEPLRSHTPQGEVLHTLPKCVQSPDPAPGWCQQTRFGERVGFDTENWCAFWVPFSPCS